MNGLCILQGAFTPVTMEGNIVVHSVLASCYASSPHDLAQFAITPMKMFPEIMKWIFGDYNGFSGYTLLSEELGKWMQPGGIFQDY